MKQRHGTICPPPSQKQLRNIGITPMWLGLSLVLVLLCTSDGGGGGATIKIVYLSCNKTPLKFFEFVIYGRNFVFKHPQFKIFTLIPSSDQS